jgi:AGZA family xanthine/uracil permease-like MFS transporter
MAFLFLGNTGHSMTSVRQYFHFDRYGTSFRQETVAGVTTFVTMAYIIVVNPAILEAAGIPEGPSMVATILTAIVGTLIMGLYANRPIAVAPYMGENAFIAYTVVQVLGFPWQTALGAVFIGGLLFTFLTLLKLRGWLANAIPLSLKQSFSVGIGLFLAFLGLTHMGVVTLGVPGAPVQMGNLGNPQPLLGLLGLVLMILLLMRRIKGALLLGIFAITGLSFVLGLTPIPDRLVGLPPDLSPIFLQLNIHGALSMSFVSVVITVLVMDFVDTMGTLIGVSSRAGFLDGAGNLPEIEKPMLADALSTVAAGLLGTSTAGAYIESATGIEEGGRTGFTALVVATLFALALFFTPLSVAVPPCAYGPALVVVGMFMLQSATQMNLQDYSELIPAFLTITLMIFTFNIGVGITAGFIAYPLGKLFTGRIREVPGAMWVLSVVSVLFFLSYPYR